MIRVLLILLLLTGCSQQQVKSHIGTTAGAISGYATCHSMLNAGIELTAACTLIGGMIGSSLFYDNDMNVHTAVFVDTLNTAPGKISNTNWGNSATGNWGSIKINRTYLVGAKKCRDYESTINIEPSWPVAYFSSGPVRKTNWGTACIMPDGRVVIK